jgi:hypothetical protein
MPADPKVRVVQLTTARGPDGSLRIWRPFPSALIPDTLIPKTLVQKTRNDPRPETMTVSVA